MPDRVSDRVTQAEIIEFLSRSGTLAADEKPEIIQTHCAYVFLTSDLAFKLKRAVKYDYLDYSTTDLRRKMLARELTLNQPSAPSIYMDTVAITQNTDGTLSIGGSGTPVDWLLRMKRFPASNELSVIAKTHGLSDKLSADMGIRIAEYHAAAETRRESGAALIREIIDELETAFADMTEDLGETRIQSFRTACRAQYQGGEDALLARSEKGWVRRCHGDLHLRNIVLIDGVPTPFDALEFDERLGTCDVLYDLAFLLMDLMHQGFRRPANIVLNSYTQAASDFDTSGLRALPLYLGLRAAIRAMVDIQTLRAGAGRGMTSDARAYLDQAIGYLRPPTPRLIAIGGVSGTGKTTVARAVAPLVGAAPGALHLRSDIERKRMYHVDPTVRLPLQAYRQEVTDEVYAHLHEQAHDILAAGHSVILDATHMNQGERRATEEIATHGGFGFLGIWLQGDSNVLLDRVSAREGDASDADKTVVEKMLAKDIGQLEWHRVDCNGPKTLVVERVRDLISSSAV